MTTKTDQDLFRPYAPPANVVATLQRVRRMNMPPKVGKEFLLGAGITSNTVTRVLAALKFLELVDDEDRPTDSLRALASCPDEEYKQLLELTIRTAYASDFVNIDPTVDSQQKIIDTFQRYTPKSQHSRQVMLLLGLCREAGMTVVDSPRERPMQQHSKTNRTRSQSRADDSRTHGTASRPREVVPPQSAGLLFGVTEEDIAALDDKEFDEVWSALGKVARARTRAARDRSVAQHPTYDKEEEDTDEQ